MNASGNPGRHGIGGPSGDAERPDFVGPDFAPPAQPPDPSNHPDPPDHPSLPARTGAKRSPIVLIMVAVFAGLAVLATIAVLVRSTRQPGEEPLTASRSSSPAPTVRPSRSTEPPATTDELGRGLRRTGLACVRVTDDPVFNHCGAKPGAPFAMFRWLVDDGRLTGFRFYGMADTDRDTELFERRIRQLHQSGPSRADEHQIIKAMSRAKKINKTVDLSGGWGKISVTYIESAKSFQVIGTRDGKPIRFDGPAFEPKTPALIRHLKRHKFSCTDDPESMTCTRSSGSLTFYRALGDSYNVVSSVPREGAADTMIVELLPFLLGADVATVRPMVVDHLDAPYYLGGDDGYLVQISPSELTIEGVGW